jgi:uncharacterized coiled-coil DUF342 family protein
MQELTGQLEGRIQHRRATVQKLQKQVEALETVRAERMALEARVKELQARLVDTRVTARDQRPMINPWAIAVIVVALFALAAALLRRRAEPS